MLRSDRGQSLMFVVFALPVIFGVLLFVVDGSLGFAHKRNLQAAADAAALAAAADLANGVNPGTSAGQTTLQTDIGKYSGLNGVSNTALPDHACATNAQHVAIDLTSCFQAPYYDSHGNSHADQVLVLLHRTCDTTFFGKVFGVLRHSSSPKVCVAARAVGGITSGEPPPYSFVAFNNTCDNHTLVIRLSGHLTVTNQIYVNSCSAGDGFDVFGSGGDIKDPVDILTTGGWETHDGDLVYVGKDGSGNYIQCTAGPKVNATDPWQAGCPHTNQPTVQDPFAVLPPPSLGDYPSITNSSCTVANPCYPVSPFSPPYFLAASISSTATSLTANAPTGSASTLATIPCCAPANTSAYLQIGGERVGVSNVGGATAEPFPGHAVTITRHALNTAASAHSETTLNVIGEQEYWDAANNRNVATLTTSTPHNLGTNSWVRVNLTQNNFDGIYQEPSAADEPFPDDEISGDGPHMFKYYVPAPQDPDVGGGIIQKARRYNGTATLTLAAALPASYHVNDHIDVNVDSGDQSFDEALEDNTISNINSGTKQFSYSQFAMPDTVDTIHQIGRFDGTATVVTAHNGFPNLGTANVSYPPDPSFSGAISSLVGTPTNNKFSYASPGPDVGFTVADTQPVIYAARWNNVATIETNPALGGIQSTSPNNRVAVNLVGDTSFNGAFDINSGSLVNGNKTFSYANTGSNSSLGSDIAVTQINRGANTATLNVSDVSTLDVGDLVIVNTSNSTFNNGGNPVVLTSVKTTAPFQIKYANTGPNVGNTAVSGSKINLVGGAPSAGSTVDRRTSGLTTVDGAGGPCAAPTACTSAPYDDASVGGVAGSATISCSGCVIPDPLQIDSVANVAVTAASVSTPFPWLQPAGTTKTLNPGIYYGGICIGAPAGATCNPNNGGSCDTSTGAANATNVTLSDGVYIIAGGGFYVCGNASVTGNHVLIYNTVDSQAPLTSPTLQWSKLGQVEFNTNGNIDLHPRSKDELYGGFLIWQGKDPASPAGNLALAPATKCDGRAANKTDILLQHTGGSAAHPGDTTHSLDGFEGTIYAPNNYALFTDQIGGTANLAVLTGCIYIAGADSTFAFIPDHLGGLGSGLAE